MLKGAEYLPAHEPPDEHFPLQLITGRTIYHFHTRTKTGRAPELQAAAPQVWVEICAADAAAAGITAGDLTEIATPRGRVRAAARITGIRPGVIFLPFHYGYWDTGDSAGPRATPWGPRPTSSPPPTGTPPPNSRSSRPRPHASPGSPTAMSPPDEPERRRRPREG